MFSRLKCLMNKDHKLRLRKESVSLLKSSNIIDYMNSKASYEKKKSISCITLRLKRNFYSIQVLSQTKRFKENIVQ